MTLIRIVLYPYATAVGPHDSLLMPATITIICRNEGVVHIYASREQGLPNKPGGGEEKGKKYVLHVYPLDSTSYSHFVLRPHEGPAVCTLVLLVDRTSRQKGEELIRAYGGVLSRFRYRNLQTFFLCHRGNRKWFEGVLKSCPDLSPEEVELRIRGCDSGGVATAVLLFGAKKQLVLFPNKFEVVRRLCGGGAEGGGRGGAPSDVGDDSSASGRSGSDNLRHREVGRVLGNTLGYESSEEEASGEEEAGLRSHDTSKLNSTHKPHAGGERYLELMGQVRDSFQHWCERLADGSLKRYRVEVWPEWTHP